MSEDTTTSYMPEGMPLPAPNELDAPFWEGAKNHKLLVQHCPKCGTFQFGPEWICYNCRSAEVGWHECSGKGTVYAFERVWHPVHPAVKDRVPYLIVLVELPDAGNVRMVGNSICICLKVRRPLICPRVCRCLRRMIWMRRSGKAPRIIHFLCSAVRSVARFSLVRSGFVITVAREI